MKRFTDRLNIPKDYFAEEFPFIIKDTSPSDKLDILGSDFQFQKMYSEEEVRKISLDFFYHWWNSKGTNTEQGFDKWFEQFKKK